jgi:hypothetical protein
MLVQYKVEKNFLTLQPAKFWVRDEAPNLKAEDVTLCCLFKAVKMNTMWNNGGIIFLRGDIRKSLQ